MSQTLGWQSDPPNQSINKNPDIAGLKKAPRRSWTRFAPAVSRFAPLRWTRPGRGT